MQAMLLPLEWPDPIDPPAAMAPAPPPPKPLDVAALSWADAEPETDEAWARERRWLARRILIVRAVGLAEVRGCSCREAWRLVKRLYAAGLVYTPANV